MLNTMAWCLSNLAKRMNDENMHENMDQDRILISTFISIFDLEDRLTLDTIDCCYFGLTEISKRVDEDLIKLISQSIPFIKMQV